MQIAVEAKLMEEWIKKLGAGTDELDEVLLDFLLLVRVAITVERKNLEECLAAAQLGIVEAAEMVGFADLQRELGLCHRIRRIILHQSHYFLQAVDVLEQLSPVN